MAGRSIIVMGVCGSGKSTIGEGIAKQLDAKFIDGDNLHPKANIQKMASGQPLDDQDRAPWLERINDAAYSLEAKNEVGIIVCSALKKAYRDQIREGNHNVNFIFLEGDRELILERVSARKGHFMAANMVDSQFATLEVPTGEAGVITVSCALSIEEMIAEAVHQLAL